MREWVPFLSFCATYVPFAFIAWCYKAGESWHNKRLPGAFVICMIGIFAAIAVASSLQGWANGP